MMEKAIDKELRILILEDIVTDAELMEHELRKAGITFCSRCAQTKEAFLKELEDFVPDIILADYSLPQFEGISALAIAREKCPDVPFILVSGVISEEVAIEVVKSGATDYVLKQGLSCLVPSVRRVLREAGEKAERKRAEDALRLSHQELQAAFNAIHDGMNVVDLNFNITDINDFLVKAFGLTDKESILGRKCFEVLKGRKDICPDCAVAEAYRTKTAAYRTTTPEDEVSTGGRRFEIFAYPIIDEHGNPSGAVEFARDITGRKRAEEELRRAHDELETRVKERTAELTAANEQLKLEVEDRKKAEEALRESEERYRRITNAVTNYILTVRIEDGHPVETIHGPACIAVTGYTSEEYASDPNLWIRMVTEEDREIILEQANRILSGQDTQPIEHRILRKDGVIRWVKNTLVPHYDTEGRLLSYDGLISDITERKRAEEEIKLAYLELDQIFQTSADGMRVVDKDFNMIRINDTFAVLSGVNKDEALGKKCYEVFPGPCCHTPICSLRRVLNGEEHIEFESIRERKEGTKVPCVVTVNPFRGVDGEIIGVVENFKDITERRRAEKEMKKLSMSVEQATDWVVITDKDGNIEYVNKAVEEITAYKKEELIGKNPRVFKSDNHDEKFYKELWDTILSGRPFLTVSTNKKKNGELFYLSQTISPLRDEKGNITHFVSTGKDITQQKLMEKKLNYLAYYDALTGLPNRNLFIDRLNQILARAGFHKRLIAVLAIDIDRFKSINDTFGLEVGDNVLKEVAGILSTSTRKGDTVARLGSDDFGIVLNDIAHSEDVILVVDKIMQNVSYPIKLNEREVMLTLSIGISVYPDDGKDVQELMRNADLALSKAKQQGRKNFQFYTSDMNVKASEFVLMEEHLINALRDEEFLLYYQPYWEINTKKIVGMEALLRWQSRDIGLVSPGRFIPVLEETGMIIEVGEWIFRTACRQVKEWHDKGYPVPVSINLSLVQFRQRELAETLGRIINESGVDPQLLTVEITESAFMQDVEFTNSVLKKLKDIGVSISIDDFGTGYSSLSYLKRFPVDNLKIDISFIRDIVTDPDTASIVTAIIAMARTLGLETIAEGVETEEQWKILRLLRCHMGQGYLFSPPLPAKDAEKLLI